MRTKYQVKWDAISIGASVICAIHCVLLPVIFTTITLSGIEILENPYLEAFTLLISMGIGGWAIWRGYKQLHHRKELLVYFFAGLALMLTGNFIHHTPVEMFLKITGAVLLITAHIKNLRSCRH